MVGELLTAASTRLRQAGSDSPRLDAELLLGHVLHVDRTALLAQPEARVSSGQSAAFESALERRVAGEPVAYIRAIKEFYGVALAVDRRALIPRPETETLVDIGLARLSRALTTAPRSAGDPPLLIWDVGTGSGAVCVALAIESRRRGYAADVRLVATDVSTDALALAAENAAVHGVGEMIDFAPADLLALPDALPADLILANLPYIPSDTVPQLPVAASFEPVAALDGGPDGLAVIRRLLEELPAGLAATGVALIEFGADQADALASAVAELRPGWQLEIHADLGGRPRVAELRRGVPPG
jgi:release factor glutamine methyltransferase